MALFAICLPILPGKKEKWLEMAEKFKTGPMSETLKASREKAGVHERTFLQSTPQGDLVIVTLEGDNPAEALGAMMQDPTLKEFSEWAADVHGFDPSGPLPPPPELVFDSKA
jgi:hypothetical protein